MKKEETRGRKKNPLYFGVLCDYKLLRVPMYNEFKQIADEKGVSVVELIFIILLEYLEQEKGNNESIRKDKTIRGGE